MSAPRSGFDGRTALVPGELRGYRQFRLESDGLYPLVQASLGPWSDQVQHAVCANGATHPAPDRDCSCGLYGWYHPDSTTGFVDEVSAVITVRGRTILGQWGFRAAAARIDAVALPWSMWVRPSAARRARQMLTVRYPHAQVYASRRRMVAEHPGQDLRALGVTVQPARARRHLRMALSLWVLVVLGCYGTALLGGPPPWVWLGAVLGIVAAQIAAVPLLARRPGDHRGSA